MKRILLLTLLLCIGISITQAQSLVIKGQVIDDSSNVGLPDVSVVVASTRSGVQTDKDGNFTITTTGRTASLRVSYVGYTPQTISADATRPIVVRLRKAQTSLDDVVVVGYATVRRRDLT